MAVQRGGVKETLQAEQLLVATGRRANTHGLALDRAGVNLDRRGFVQADEFMRTSNHDVVAAGDVVGGPQRVHVAAAGGVVTAETFAKGITQLSCCA